MKESFVREIEHLLSLVPPEQWRDPAGVCGVMYDFMPWHKASSLTVQTREDDVNDPAAWKYYFSAESDASRIEAEIAEYLASWSGRLEYHKLLIEAAEAMLSIDFSQYGQPKTVDDFCLYGPFQVRVSDPDGTFSFNYCEYVLARRLDEARASAG